MPVCILSHRVRKGGGNIPAGLGREGETRPAGLGMGVVGWVRLG